MILTKSLHLPRLLIPTITTTPTSLPDNILMSIMVTIFKTFQTYNTSPIKSTLVTLNKQVTRLEHPRTDLLTDWF